MSKQSRDAALKEMSAEPRIRDYWREAYDLTDALSRHLAIVPFPTSQQHAPIENELVAALRFYADPRKYKGANRRPEADEEARDDYRTYQLDVTFDGGAKARAALAKLEGAK